MVTLISLAIICQHTNLLYGNMMSISNIIDYTLHSGLCYTLHPWDCAAVRVYLLLSFMYFAQPLTPLLSSGNPSFFSVTLSLLPFCLFIFFLILHVSEIMWYCLSLTDFTEHNTLCVHTRCCKWQDVILFLQLRNILLCI